ncbi:MAG TPA: redox-regulated ATPase YchF [Patescibacteria group bacterium]|nr:redox-regulated ATPase YchF [Patescibacteria group bacterium]
MGLSLAIVGLPNVGKSSLFNLLTKTKAEASNYPFCTIDPNVGIVEVPDERLTALTEISKSQKTIPTAIEFVDVAGLVKGAHKGEGLGNQFLANIRECDAICEVIRDFQDENIIHVTGKINPQEDRETINLELIFADLSTISKRMEKAQKETKTGDKEKIAFFELLQKLKTNLENGVAIRDVELSEKEEEIIKQLNLLTIKPILYIVNTDSPEKYQNKNEENTLAINVKIEQEIVDLPPSEQEEFLKELNMGTSGLNKLIKASYSLLNLETFLTTGPEESRAWTIKKGATAPEAASVIHTDFQKHFIRVEIINWKDLINAGSEKNAKEQGLIRTEGKDYIVKDGDVCHFLINK